jgi:hypothetical protein
MDKKITIESIENVIWQKPDFNSSKLEKKCYELRKKNIDDLSTEDLRLLISQNIGLKALIPKAILILTEEPFIEGDFYEGDLLQTVLNVDNLFWSENFELHETVKNIFDNHINQLEELDLTTEIKNNLLRSRQEF